MEAYSRIDEVQPGMRIVGRSSTGWSCTFWSNLLDDEAPHRRLLEAFARRHPEAGLELPAYDRYEDYVTGSFQWAGSEVEIYYETILSQLILWSKDRDAVEGARRELMAFQTSRS